MTSFHAFLGGIVDYAGLFPPAQLPLDQALRNHTRHLAEEEAWLLGRFVCPAARLEELVPLASEHLHGNERFVVAALGRGGKDVSEYFANVETDLVDIARCRDQMGDKGRVDAYEVRLPATPLSPPVTNQFSSLIATTANLIESAGPPLLAAFFEAPLTDRATLLAVIQALDDDHQSIQASSRGRCQPAGFKLRTGGLEPAAFPTCEQLALVLAACARARVPFKATAGLHHPFRHVSAEANAVMHGFVNVFAAGCWALIHGLEEARVLAIVEDENPAHFHLEPAGLRWRDLVATPVELAQARKLFTSFGSCSFDEPREDLRRLGWVQEG